MTETYVWNYLHLHDALMQRVAFADDICITSGNLDNYIGDRAIDFKYYLGDHISDSEITKAKCISLIYLNLRWYLPLCIAIHSIEAFN